MNTVLTIVQAFLLIGITLGGLGQILISHERYARLPSQGWAADFKPWHVKLIGSLKLAASAGMIASLLVPSLAVLMPLAALGFAFVMAGAIATHLRREEYPVIAGNLVYLGLALFIAYSTLFGFAA